MPATIPFVTRVHRNALTLQTTFVVTPLSPPTQVPPTTIIETRGATGGWDDLRVAAPYAGTSFLDLRRGDDGADVIVHWQAIDWTVGAQP